MFDATMVSAQWPLALDRLATSLGAAGAILIPKNPDKIELGFPTSRRLTEVMGTFVQANWHRNDIRADRGWPLMERRKSVIIEHDLVTETEKRSLPYFNELFNPFGLPWFAAVGFKFEGAMWCLTLIRGAGQGPYRPADVAPFVALPPLLRRIVQMAFQFRSALDAPLLNLVTLLGHRAMLVDQSSKVIGIGDGVLELLGEGLSLRQGRLVADNRPDDIKVQALLDTAAKAKSPSIQPQFRPVAIARPAKRPLVVDAIALPGVARDVFTSATALVLLKDTADPPATRPELIARLLKLTPAEAQLASLVGNGASPQDAADILGVTRETARTTLKRVFSKTSVSRQSELALLIARLGAKP